MTLSPLTSHQPSVAGACPVCDAQDLSPFFDLGARHFERCDDCQAVFQFPLPTLLDAKAKHTDRYDGATRGYFAKADKKLRKARFEMSLFSWLLPPGARFLDVGCNGGFMAHAAYERGFDAHGLDVDAVSIAYAREHYPNATFHLGSAEQLPASAGQFDMIHCSEVIEHVPQAKDFIFAIARALKPRGLLYLTTPNIYHWSVRRDVRRFKAMRSDAHCLFYSPSGLRRTMRGVGIDYRFSVPNLKPGMRMLFRKQP